MQISHHRRVFIGVWQFDVFKNKLPETASFSFIFVFSKTIQFWNKYMWNITNFVATRAGIRNHDVLVMSLLLKPLHQGSCVLDEMTSRMI